MEQESPLTDIFNCINLDCDFGIILFPSFQKNGRWRRSWRTNFLYRKSKAKLFDEKERIQVTFKDVAGLEGAKEEVQEVVDFLKTLKNIQNWEVKFLKEFFWWASGNR
jgi:cell division protease FtsH